MPFVRQEYRFAFLSAMGIQSLELEENAMAQPTERFTATVENYLKYRPAYPVDIVQLLINECHLTKESIIADIGSGTGFLAKLFLERGNLVYGIEPNEAMRKAGERYLQDYPHFVSKAGTAEAIPLPDASVDFITVGTAFHWFDPIKTKQEFCRILKPSGWVMLVWNVWQGGKTPLMKEYEQLILRYSTDYQHSAAEKFNDSATGEFFSPHVMQVKSFDYVQRFDWEGFQGRLLSSSYSLRSDSAEYEAMIAGLRAIYERYQHNGTIEFVYQTKVYYGQLK